MISSAPLYYKLTNFKHSSHCEAPEMNAIFRLHSQLNFFSKKRISNIIANYIIQPVNENFKGNWKVFFGGKSLLKYILYPILCGAELSRAKHLGYVFVFGTTLKYIQPPIYYVSMAYEYIYMIHAIARWAELRWQQHIV